jgi:hypothetical protein
MIIVITASPLLHLERQEMYNQVIFYNHFGAGDIFESREFVKAWMKLVPAHNYLYAHGKNPRILLDIPELKFMEITPHMNPRVQIWDDQSGNLYVNTWIGITGKYLLPGIGCTVERLYDMHNDMLSDYNLGKLLGIPIDYIPHIKYDYYNINKATDFVMNRKGDLIFIDNGLTQSLQAENFDFNPVIEEIAKSHPEKTFIATQPFARYADNIFFTNDIIGNDGFDLPEISYISLFCSVLIGRNSGPHVFTQVNQNVFDRKKKLLSFTYKVTGSSFVVNTPAKIQKYWSDVTSKEDVVHMIESVLND